MKAKTKRVYALNASGWSPSGLTPQMLADHGQTTMPQRGIFA